MNDELPPYARALKNRQSHQRHSFGSDSFSQSLRSSLSPYNTLDQPFEEDPGESNHLREIIADLEIQVAELTAENQKIPELQQQLEIERNNATEFGRMLDEKMDLLAKERTKNQTLEEQVAQLESFLQDKNTIVGSKESCLQRLQSEYSSLFENYQKQLDIIGVQTGQLRNCREKISELENEIEFIKSKPPPTPPRNEYISQRNDYPPMNDFNMNNGFNNMNELPVYSPQELDSFPKPNLDSSQYRDRLFGENDWNQANTNYHPQNEFANTYSSPKSPQPYSSPFSSPEIHHPMRRSANSTPIRAALVDNISFDGYSENENRVFTIDTDGMSIPEMKTKLQQLQIEKDDLEKKMNGSPRAGASLAVYKREQGAIEASFDMVAKEIAKLKLTLKQLHAM